MGLQAVLADVQARLAPIDAAVCAAGAADPIVRALDTIPGIGAVLGVTMRARECAVYGNLSDVAAGLMPLGGDPREGHDRGGPFVNDGSPPSQT